MVSSDSMEGEETDRALDLDQSAPGVQVTEAGGGKAEVAVDVEESEKEKNVKRRLTLGDEEEDLNMSRKKRVRSKKLDGSDGKPKESAREKKKLEKARKAELEHLHAESQRLLRETRNASFKPVQLIQKPISSVLEKIRMRKLEMLKSRNMFRSMPSVACDDRSMVSDCNLEPVHMHCDRKVTDNNTEVLDVGSKSTYQYTTNDSQADKNGSQSHTRVDNQFNDQEVGTHLNLSTSSIKNDYGGNDDTIASSSDYDVSSSEEENDKENIGPSPCNVLNMDSSPKKGLAKTFLDDEAEEEDDSDCDLLRFQDNEEENETDEHEDLADLIATGYEEAPMDQEKRNELHQKWLEQQDAAETDNVLQRLKSGHRRGQPSFLNGHYNDYDGSDNYEDGRNDTNDDGEDEAEYKNLPIDSAHQSLKKAKQMISRMFTDDDDAYTPSDDEETEKSLIRHHHILRHNEETSLFVSPAEDENSRDFFGLIKKLNIAQGAKKKGKASAQVRSDSLVLSGNSNSSSKSSFVNRACNSLPSSHKKSSCSVKAFIFGRDDSNSRSNIATLEINSETVSMESISAKDSMKGKPSSIKKRKEPSDSEKGSSLFNILRQSSSVQFDRRGNHAITETQAAHKFSAFRLRKNPKIGGF